MELVAVEELVEHYATRRQPMVRVVLIVVVAVAVRSDALSAELVIFELDVAPSERTPF